MESFSKTDVGSIRVMNQDSVFSKENAIGNLPNLFVVADGMGGHKAGDLASRLCVETLVKALSEAQLVTPVSLLNDAINKANEEVFFSASQNPDYEGMGTTLVAATISENCLYVANIGDSRCYIAGDRMVQITEDHSYVEELVRKGELTREEVRNHPRKNVITRALGTNYRVFADVFEVELQEGDMILLCSDGLTNMVENEEIYEIIKRKDLTLSEKGELLINRANEYGGKDNISVVLVKP